jgi:hypothetical protein
MATVARRVRRWLAGEDGPDRDALPAGELLHPAALAAVALLVVNDHLLKGPGPGWLTGKLSDVAGLVFAPLLLTTLVDCALAGAARLGAPVDPSLRPKKLGAALIVIGAGFVLVELVAPVTALYLGVLDAVGLPSRATRDATDLFALPALGLAWWIGRGEIARVPLGRLAAVRRRAAGEPGRAAALLADVRARAADPAAVDALAAALAGGDDDGVRRALDRLRG